MFEILFFWYLIPMTVCQVLFFIFDTIGNLTCDKTLSKRSKIANYIRYGFLILIPVAGFALCVVYIILTITTIIKYYSNKLNQWEWELDEELIKQKIKKEENEPLKIKVEKINSRHEILDL